MANKSMEEKIDDLALAVGRGFEDVYQRIDTGFREVHGELERIEDRLERIESKVTGLSGRVEVLEDTMRMVRTKLSI